MLYKIRTYCKLFYKNRKEQEAMMYSTGYIDNYDDIPPLGYSLSYNASIMKREWESEESYDKRVNKSR